jgi:SAM-dependent methyltransferase
MQRAAHIRFSVLAAACVALAATAAQAQLEAINQPPVVGGKDVMWVPTPDAAVDRMLSIANAGPRDLVYDLGSGDGKIAIMAARRFGARAVGVEFDSDMIELSRAAARKEGVADRVRFVQADIFGYDFRDATVVTLYLLTSLNVKLRPKILDMKPGRASPRTCSGWRNGNRRAGASARARSILGRAGKVAGTWVMTRARGCRRARLRSAVPAHLRLGANRRETLPLTQALLRGDEIRFAFAGEGGARLAFTGRVAGDRIVGDRSAEPWSAVRVRAR